jgi:acyl-CoA dehydrogenase
VRGERVCSIAITEPGAGSVAAGIATRATLDEVGRWHLSGQKHFISDGLVSDFFLVSAVTGETGARNEISLFLVDKGLKGFSIARSRSSAALATARICPWNAGTATRASTGSSTARRRFTAE